jgi:glycosyltransferase involved in cell wall biosynthesis
MSLPGALHLTDTLALGGAERMAVNLANLTPRDRYRVFFCATRAEGPLIQTLAPDVERICLARRRRFDLPALKRLIEFIRANDIRLLHAHSTALFVAMQASLFAPHPRVVWHDHFGRYATEERSVLIYRLLTWRVSGVFSVNQQLADWAVNRLRLPADRVWYVPNFVADFADDGEAVELPGVAGKRIVCVANLRPEKDHLTLARAMALVVAREPEAHLLLAGAISDQSHFAAIREEITRLGLDRHITFLNAREKIAPILRGCDIGALSSASEGLPLALIEYGKAGLAAVATRVGQCAEVLDDGKAGIITPPRDPEKLAEALLTLLNSAEKRRTLGLAFRRRVDSVYSPAPIIERICRAYDSILNPQSDEA